MSLSTQPKEIIQEDKSTIKRILQNALEHFSHYGYSGASVREITQASQVTKPTLYYYFKNKEELYLKLSNTCFEEIAGVMEEAMTKKGNTLERAMHLISEYCRLCAEKRSVVRFVYLISASPDRSAPDVGILKFGERLRHFITTVVLDGVERGEVKAEDVEAISFALYGSFYLCVAGQLANSPIVSDLAIVRKAVAKILS